MIFKPGVRRDPVHPEVYYAHGVVDVLTRQMCGREAVCTSVVRDPTPGGSSLHPLGLAADYRTRDQTVDVQRRLTSAVRDILDDRWDVILEGPASADTRYQSRVAHLHVELDVQ